MTTATRRRAILPADTTDLVRSFVERCRSGGVDFDERFAGCSPERLESLARGEVQRVGLSRTITRDAADAAASEGESDGLTIEGYGAVFNTPTEINSWEGHFSESIAPGAFKKSLREQTPKMQFDHGMHPMLGGLPLGRWDVAEEDDHGLHVLGRMYDGWMFEPFRQAIADPAGGVDGMSFRFSVVREDWADADGKKIKDDELFELLFYGAGDRGPITRTLREVKVPEVGPVVWPAYAETEVGARSRDGGRFVVDLGALRHDPRALADLVALMDAEAASTVRSQRAARMREVTRTADRAADPLANTSGADAVNNGRGVHNGGVHTGSRPTGTEPRTTDDTAAGHLPNGTPTRTADSAGAHSPSDEQMSPTRPLNPADRKAAIQARYRDRLTDTLALTTETPS